MAAPSWRDGVIAAAAQARALAANARSIGRAFRREEEAGAVACALDNLARDLAYIASQPAHEGLRALRKLGCDDTRAWAAEFASTGFEPRSST
jgi:hypothetical protein